MTASPSDVWLCDVNVVDVMEGRHLRAANVHVRDGRIARISRRALPRSAIRRRDLGGAYLLPGLWNVHAHMGSLGGGSTDAIRLVEHSESVATRTIRAGQNLRSALEQGITGVRNMAEAYGVDLAWRAAATSGATAVPNLVVSGKALTSTGGHLHDYPSVITADGPAEFRGAARSQLAEGADLIKLMVTGGIATANEGVGEQQLLGDEIAAAVNVARAKRKPVAVHAAGGPGLEEALKAGVQSVEHGYQLDERLVAMMSRAGTCFVPTLYVTSPENRKRMVERGVADSMIAKLDEVATSHSESVRMAIAAGVHIAVGGDVNPIGVTAISEVEALGRHGLPTLEALKAATISGARVCGMDRVAGSIEVGKLADLVAVREDPMGDLSRLRDRVLVLRAGRIVYDADDHPLRAGALA